MQWPHANSYVIAIPKYWELFSVQDVGVVFNGPVTLTSVYKFKSWLFRVFFCLGSLAVRAGVQLLAAEGLQAGPTTGAYKLLLGSRWWGWELFCVCSVLGFTAALNGRKEKVPGCAPLSSSVFLSLVSGNEQHFLCEWDEHISHSVALVRLGEAAPTRGLVLVTLCDLPCQVVPLTRYLKVLPGFKHKDNAGITPSSFPLQGTHHPPLVSKGGHDPCTPHSAASWPWLSHPASSCAALPAWGKASQSCSGLASAAGWWPCPSSYVLLSIRAN